MRAIMRIFEWGGWDFRVVDNSEVGDHKGMITMKVTWASAMALLLAMNGFGYLDGTLIATYVI